MNTLADSGYFVGLLREFLHIDLGTQWTLGPIDGGIMNVPAFVIALLVTWLLVIGTRESAFINAILVMVKITASTTFMALRINGSMVLMRVLGA